MIKFTYFTKSLKPLRKGDYFIVTPGRESEYFVFRDVPIKFFKNHKYGFKITKVKVLTDKDGATCAVVGKTKSSIRVFVKAKSKKGIDSQDWYTNEEFSKRFKYI